MVELRAVIASKQGLSCDGYFTISARTAYLRERLYVSVTDGDKVFLPRDPHEHFPVAEIQDYYVKRLRLGLNESIGAGGSEVLFTLEGPAADEGAVVIERTLAGLEPVLNRDVVGRFLASLPGKGKYSACQLELKRPYRPEAAKLPARAFVPADLIPEPQESTFSERVETRTREFLRKWGMEDAYKEMRAKPEVPKLPGVSAVGGLPPACRARRLVK